MKSREEYELERDIEKTIIDFVNAISGIIARYSGSIKLGRLSVLALEVGREAKRLCGYQK